MSNLIPLRNAYVYGPVISRRLGRSLGINVQPANRKVCSFNCLYCQYGFAEPVPLDQVSQVQFPDCGEILREVESALLELKDGPLDHITFSGHGEPTLHPSFPELVRGIGTLRDRLSPGAKTAVLSNSSTVMIPRIRQALIEIDTPIMKIDCSSRERFRDYNQPAGDIEFKEILAGLEALRKLRNFRVQALWTGGVRGNYSETEVERWKTIIQRLDPLGLQICTLTRPGPCQEIEALDGLDF